MAKYALDAKLYRNTGSYATPTWTALDVVRNVTLNLAASEGDVSSRGSRFDVVAATSLQASVDVEMLWDTTDSGFQAFLDAFNNTTIGTTVPCLILDGASGTAGNEGLRAHMSVTQFNRTENRAEAQIANMTLKPGPYGAGEGPVWFVSS